MLYCFSYSEQVNVIVKQKCIYQALIIHKDLGSKLFFFDETNLSMVEYALTN